MAGSRDIDDVLHFRGDLSPFLVHLTKHDRDGADKITTHARDRLHGILKSMEIRASKSPISSAYFGANHFNPDLEDEAKLYGAACFTETPISEAHTLIDIKNRTVDLEPYGVAFLRDNLRAMGVSPVFYLNNYPGDKDPVASALCSLLATHRAEAELILPLVSCMGNILIFPGVRGLPTAPPMTVVDFSWEREWRMPFVKCPVSFAWTDVFMGFCPHDEIPNFEATYPSIDFIDPRRTMKWYATKLIAARQRLTLKYSVV